MDNIIETHQLKRSFQARQRKDRQTQTIEAVKGIDLVVRDGEIFSFLGPNGVGKTTTLRMLATLLPPTGGQAKVVGYDLLRESKRIRACIGYVSQAGGSDATATARENPLLQAQLHRSL
jgi:ABC-2 type transport system ATP-binding protein